MENRSIDLTNFTNYAFDSNFKRNYGDKIGVTPDAWNPADIRYFHRQIQEYSPEEVAKIIDSGSIRQQQRLSYNYFLKDGMYRRIIFYYATLLQYYGILIPESYPGSKLSEKSNSKKYFMAMRYVNKMDIPTLLTRITIKALLYGNYYGVIQEQTKDRFVVIDLPAEWCRSRFRSVEGNDLVEFDVSYFDTIVEPKHRDEALRSYPKSISKHYRDWSRGKASQWILLSNDIGLSFKFFDDGRPMFLNTIPATINYDAAVETEQERELEEIRKIIVQKIPHLNDGQLVFEPDEALEMHRGAVNMLRNNPNLSVLTSYADVEAILSRTAADNSSNSLTRMLQNVYSNTGVSSQIFSSESPQTVMTSIKNDISLMMILANKYSHFISNCLNSLYGNSVIQFSYQILPVSLYNQTDYITDTMKLAQTGYSFLLPGLAAGLNQSQLINVKYLENNVLKLGDIFKPLQSSYTQSGNDSGSEEKTGRPAAKTEDKAEQTIANEDSPNTTQGGSN